MAKFSVPEVNYFRLVEKIANLNKKAVKLGTSPITLDVIDSHFEEYTNPEGDKLPVKVINIEVVGESPKLNGWQFAAKLEHTEAGNVMYSLIDGDLPARFRTVEPRCEHCQTNRNRINTYVVVNEASEFKQVGSSCLKDFTGHANPERLAQWAEHLIGLFGECSECEYDPDSYSGKSDYVHLHNLLENASAVIRQYGWTSRGDVYDGLKQGPASADLALSNLFAKFKSQRVEVITFDVDLAEAVIKWVREEVANKEDLGDYLWNLVVAIADDYITLKQVGIVASAIVAYKREQAKKAERELVEDSEYVGEIKKRQEFKNLALTFSTSFDTAYGISYLYKFVDENGNVLTWFSSNFFEWTDGQTVVSGKGTVKKHEEYQGVKQTVLTRCKFEAAE